MRILPRTHCSCGIAAVESAYLIANNLSSATVSVDLSEQQAISCAYLAPYGSLGCTGGRPEDVYTYSTLNNLTKESIYPYLSSDGASRTCNQNTVTGTQAGQVVKSTGSITYVYPTKVVEPIKAVRVRAGGGMGWWNSGWVGE